MTLPTDTVYPNFEPTEEIGTLNEYIEDLVEVLQDRDTEISLTVNGKILSSFLNPPDQWQPTLYGSTVAGNFTYEERVGWCLRQGLMTDVYFDLRWSANGGATGNLYIELPYRVANSTSKPFVGVVQTATLAYGAGQSYLTLNAIPNTYRCEIWSSGSGNATANISAVPAGQLIGHVRYIGVDNE